jgi:hypothetical protein
MKKERKRWSLIWDIHEAYTRHLDAGIDTHEGQEPNHHNHTTVPEKAQLLITKWVE